MSDKEKLNELEKKIYEFHENAKTIFWTEKGFTHPDKRQPEILYHYTSSTAFSSILQNKCFWISKSDFLNDSLEMIYTEQIISEICEEIFTPMEFEDGTYLQLIKENLEECRKQVNIFILSLSINGDSLALWSNYSKCEGYNIGLNFKLLTSYLYDNNVTSILSNEKEEPLVSFGYVIYDQEVQKELLTIQLKELRELYTNYIQFYSKEIYKQAMRKLLVILVMYSIFFKSPGFSQEEEYRIAIFTENDNINDKVKYRICNGVFIPYTEIFFKHTIDNNCIERKSIPLECVTIGPKNNLDIAENGVRSFLDSLGYPKIDISKSKIALRY